MQSFKTTASAERFCQAYDEVRDYFKYRGWHKERRSAGWQRADFKSKFLRLKH
jgi:hypothetical protein